MASDDAAPTYFNTNVLNLCGLRGLGSEDAQDLLNELNEQLELTVGSNLSRKLTTDQLTEFAAIIDSIEANHADSLGRTDDDAIAWLARNVPNYRDVVSETFQAMAADLRHTARRIAEACGADYLEAEVGTEPIPIPATGPPKTPPAADGF